MAQTLVEQLERLQTAIQILEEARVAEYQLPSGIRVKYHDLAALYEREKDLLARIAAQTP